MNLNYITQKWLDHDCSPEELAALKQLPEYHELKKIDKGLAYFKAPNYNTTHELETVLTKLKPTQNKTWKTYFVSIAALLVLAVGAYFYTTTLDTQVNSLAAQQTEVVLPDHSVVTLNSVSTLTYNKPRWSDKRQVTLNGEAFFKVAKGATFDVLTPSGKVTVLGTQFNVKQRDNYFDVTCYEGLVRVTYKDQKIKLHPGDRFLSINGKTTTQQNITNTQPTWMLHKSSFTSTPYKYVLQEFERQYNVTINTKGINTNQLFTGSFTHDNLQNALTHITHPMQLTYSINKSTIDLHEEKE